MKRFMPLDWSRAAVCSVVAQHLNLQQRSGGPQRAPGALHRTPQSSGPTRATYRDAVYAKSLRVRKASVRKASVRKASRWRRGEVMIEAFLEVILPLQML